MNGWRSFWASVGLACMAAAAGAEPLATEQELSLRFTNLGQAGARDSGLSSIDVVSPPLDELRIATVSPLAIDEVLPVTDPQVACGGIMEIRLTSIRPRADLQGGVFGNVHAAITSPQGALSPATLPLSGQYRLCIVTSGCGGPTLTFPLGKATPSGGFEGAGVGGVLTIGSGIASVQISVLGAPWTANTVTAFNRTNQGLLTSVQEQGFAHGPASVTGTTTLTSGVLQLVTANQITNVGIPGNADRSGVFHRLAIHFVPEPTRAVLWLSGAAAVFALGWLRRR